MSIAMPSSRTRRAEHRGAFSGAALGFTDRNGRHALNHAVAAAASKIRIAWGEPGEGGGRGEQRRQQRRQEMAAADVRPALAILAMLGHAGDGDSDGHGGQGSGDDWLDRLLLPGQPGEQIIRRLVQPSRWAVTVSDHVASSPGRFECRIWLVPSLASLPAEWKPAGPAAMKWHTDFAELAGNGVESWPVLPPAEVVGGWGSLQPAVPAELALSLERWLQAVLNEAVLELFTQAGGGEGGNLALARFFDIEPGQEERFDLTSFTSTLSV